MTGTADVLVVIVCYRATRLTIECLRSLSTEIRALPGTKVAVCENGTGDEAVRQLREAIAAEGWNDWVWLRAIPDNRGFAGGNNVIISEAMRWDNPPRYFLLLNADTIVHPHALRRLLDAIEARPDVGIVGPRLEAPDGQPQVSCFRYHSPLSEFVAAARTRPLTQLLWRHEVAMRPSDEPVEPEWISFACALIRREVVEQIGPLDDGFFLYFEDVDYCRMARRAGWAILYCPQACVLHLVGQSNEVESLKAQRRRPPRYYYAARARYLAKFYGTAGLCLANLLWTAGWSIHLFRQLVGNTARRTCDKQWLDIWTNAVRPMVKWERCSTGNQ